MPTTFFNRARVDGFRDMNQSGMTLIEVMVAVFVLAIGMLGMAALMTSSKQAGYEAVQRGTAVALAQDMIGRIRNNPESLSKYDGQIVGSGAASAKVCDSSTACGLNDLVNFDLYNWEQALMGAGETNTEGANAGGLVNPTGCITVQMDPNPTKVAGTVTVAIAWRGLQVLSNPTISTCGEGAGLYGDGDSQRQVLVVQSFIGEIFTSACEDADGDGVCDS